MTAKELILERLAHAEMPLALHQLQIASVSQTAASARLREMKRGGLVISLPIPGRKFTAWALAPKDSVNTSPANAGYVPSESLSQDPLGEAQFGGGI